MLEAGKDLDLRAVEHTGLHLQALGHELPLAPVEISRAGASVGLGLALHVSSGGRLDALTVVIANVRIKPLQHGKCGLWLFNLDRDTRLRLGRGILVDYHSHALGSTSIFGQREDLRMALGHDLEHVGVGVVQGLVDALVEDIAVDKVIHHEKDSFRAGPLVPLVHLCLELEAQLGWEVELVKGRVLRRELTVGLEAGGRFLTRGAESDALGRSVITPRKKSATHPNTMR